MYTLIYNILALNKVFNVHNYVELGAGKVRHTGCLHPRGATPGRGLLCGGLRICCVLDSPTHDSCGSR